MGFFGIFLAWYFISGRNNPKIFRKIEGNLSKIITWVILISIFGSAVPGILAASFGLFIAFLVMAAPYLFVTGIFKAIFGKSSKQNTEIETAKGTGYTYAEQFQRSGAGKKGVSMTGLTKSVPKRRKIIQKFNKKYDLNLTDKEIDRIVDASYMSYCWEYEIFCMEKEYGTIFEWYKGDSNWLRAYLHVFPIQSVSSDFEMQRQTCINVFNQIFTEINPSSFASIDDCIDAINNRYYTAFDETTFMIAYRFLEMNGKKHALPRAGVSRTSSELERLMNKYDDDVNQSSQAANQYERRVY